MEKVFLIAAVIILPLLAARMITADSHKPLTWLVGMQPLTVRTPCVRTVRERAGGGASKSVPSPRPPEIVRRIRSI